MHIISEASRYRNHNSITDIVKSIRELAKMQGRDMKNYTYKILKSYPKKSLYCMFNEIEYNKIKGE